MRPLLHHKGQARQPRLSEANHMAQVQPVLGHFSVREGVFEDFSFFGLGSRDMKPCKVFHEFEKRDALRLDLRRIGEPGELVPARDN